MSLVVKVMCAYRGNDAHPRHCHRLFAGVQEVEFIEPDRSSPASARPWLYMTFKRETTASPEETRGIELFGNVYVMNEAGKTLSSFEVRPPDHYDPDSIP